MRLADLGGTVHSTERPVRPLDRTLLWPLKHGDLRMTFPATLTLGEVDEIEQVLRITVGVMRNLASAIEAATAGETSTQIEGSTEGESAVPSEETADAQGQPQ